MAVRVIECTMDHLNLPFICCDNNYWAYIELLSSGTSYHSCLVGRCKGCLAAVVCAAIWGCLAPRFLPAGLPPFCPPAVVARSIKRRHALHTIIFTSCGCRRSFRSING